MPDSLDREPHGKHQSKKAAASGWIGSALEYYDFFIYATAASLLFPQLFFPSDNPTVAIVASLATFGVGYVARPMGAIVLGHFGDPHGRKTVLIFCMFLMGFATMGVGFCPPISRSASGAGAARHPPAHSGFRGRGRDLRRQFHDSRTRTVRTAWLLCELYPPRGAGRATPRGSGLPAARALHAEGPVRFLGLADSVPAQHRRYHRGLHHPPPGRRDPGFLRRARTRRGSCLSGRRGPAAELGRCLARGRHGAYRRDRRAPATFGATYAVQPAYGIGFPASVFLWMPVLGNILAVILIPFVGNLSDRIGRRPPVLVGALSAGLLSFAYLYAISIHNMWLAIVLSVLMWGVAYQGFNGVFPSLFPELFRTRVRVSGMAIGQNVGTTLSALLPALFVAVAPPGSANIPLKIGALTFGICLVAAFAAFTARETYRIRLDDLGDRNAVPVPKSDYDRLRAETMAGAAETA